MKAVIIFLIALFSFIIGAATSYHRTATVLAQELESCKIMLNDPHHCVSVVVENLEKGETGCLE